jgi:ribonuclease P protein component
VVYQNIQRRTAQDAVTRFGVLVGRRLGNAVTRNRIKRRLREVIRQPDMQCGPYDILILPTPSCAQLPMVVLREELGALLRRLA